MADNILILSQAAQEPEQKIFKSSLFGFKRDDVLTYVSNINKQADDLANELNRSIENLECRLTVSRNDNLELSENYKNIESRLAFEASKVIDLDSQVQSMRLEVDRANDEAATYKSRLFATSQEIAVLKADNSRLNSSINSLTATIFEYEGQRENAQRIAEQSITQAQLIKQTAIDDAKLIRDKASNDAVVLIAAAEKEKNDAKKLINSSAENIAISVTTIKAELTAVDSKIANAISELSQITSSITSTLSNTENDLRTLGIQLSEFPEPIKPIKAASPPIPRKPRKQDFIADSILSRLAKLLR